MKKNTDILISYIITAYNIQDCIGSCILSCVRQNIPAGSYEIIIIDDGSTDETLNKIQDVVNDIKRKVENVLFNIISQSNLGPGGARNTGLRNAKGIYIWWIDGDDIIMNGVTSIILNKCLTSNLDVINFSFQIQEITGEIKKYKWNRNNNEIGKKVSGSNYLSRIEWVGAPWAYIFRRDYLLANSLFFMPNIYHEDEEFIIKACFQAKRICFLNIIAYQYIKRVNSIMFQYSYKRAYDLLYVCNCIWKYVNTQNSHEGRKCHLLFYNRIIILLDQLSMIISKGKLAEIVISKNELPFIPLKESIYFGENMNNKIKSINTFFLNIIQ